MGRPNVWVTAQWSFKSCFCCFPPFHAELFLQLALMIWSGNRNPKVSISYVTSLRSDVVSGIICPWRSAVVRIKSTYMRFQSHRIFWPLEKSLPITCVQYAIYCRLTKIFLMNFFSTGKCLLAQPTFAKKGVGKESEIKRTMVHKDSCLTFHQAGSFLFYLLLKCMRKFWTLRKCKSLQLFLMKRVYIFLKMQMFLSHRKISFCLFLSDPHWRAPNFFQ